LLKILPKKPDDILVAQLFRNVASLGSIHGAKVPVSSGLDFRVEQEKIAP
jgi:hypothetical protein